MNLPKNTDLRLFNVFCILTSVFCFLSFAASAQAKYGGGSGSEADPYLIFTASQMNQIGLFANETDWDKNFKLMADIDLGAYTGTSFNIIGYDQYYDSAFNGVFDGNGHTISNFTYNAASSAQKNYVGIFGSISGATVKNLGLINPKVSALVNTSTGNGGKYIGALVGYAQHGNVFNCYVHGGSVTGYRLVGGLIGKNFIGSTITDCHAAGISVTAVGSIGQEKRACTGGLAGNNCQWSTISRCYSTGSVSALDGNGDVGGLVGVNGAEDDSIISDSYSTASVYGSDNVGGLVGLNTSWDNAFVLISNCYSAGPVSGSRRLGGLVGESYDALVENSFWDTQTSGQTTSAGGGGLSTAEMMTKEYFTCYGWNFVDDMSNGLDFIWDMYDGKTYPRLGRLGDFVEPDSVDFADFAFFAKRWMNDCDATNNYCQEADIDQHGSVDIVDLLIFCNNWLEVNPVPEVREGFETGDFSKYPWQHSGNKSWVVVQDEFYEGNFSAKSGPISDSQQSVLRITPAFSSSQVSFYRKVSSEASYDFLRFYIDDTLQGEWSGQQDWGLQSYSVAPGLHTFKWSYEKDRIEKSGSDCVWIDNITILP